MKKIVALIGLVALGASSVNVVYGEDGAPAKIWTASLRMRAFYDDNPSTMQEAINESIGYQITPSVGLSWDINLTDISVAYSYSFLYFDHNFENEDKKYSQDHTFSLLVNHTFNERYQARLSDSFVVGQEPDMLRSGDAITSNQRLSGDNIRNAALLSLDAQLTPLFGAEIGYANSFFDYDAEGTDDPLQFVLDGQIPSPSATLDRIEHAFHIDGRWHMLPETIGIVGGQFALGSYTGDEIIALLPTGALFSDVRDYRAYYLYVGADHQFRPDLSGSARIGGRYTDYINDPGTDNSLSPYFMGSLTWTYSPDSYLQGGMSYDLSATDVVNPSTSSVVTDAQRFNIFASVHQRITPAVMGTLTTQLQHSEFQGGSVDGDAEWYYLIGLNARYQINRYLSAEVGYNWDKIDSSIGRSFSRNRIYIGMAASY